MFASQSGERRKLYLHAAVERPALRRGIRRDWPGGAKSGYRESTGVDALLRKSMHDVAKMRQHAYRTNRPVLDAVFDVLPLVRRCWGPIVNLAFKLEQGNAIGHDDVIAALSIPSATETEGYAAAIRGGRTPGTFTLSAAAG